MQYRVGGPRTGHRAPYGYPDAVRIDVPAVGGGVAYTLWSKQFTVTLGAQQALQF
ncbi:hypothetical protein [Nocardia aurantia]|nr:hypothetical protein [Nocardia aurantia]